MGYARALRVGERILVSGTTATGPDGAVVGGNDPAKQADFIIDKMERAIRDLGGRLEDVIRTNIYVANAEDWEKIGRVLGRRFGHVRPVNTLVEVKLVGPEFLLEIDCEAVVGSGDAIQPPPQ